MSYLKEKYTHKPDPVPAGLLLNPVHFLSLGFGSGLSRIAPGTMGTLAAIPVYLFIHELSPLYYSLLVLLFLFSGFWLCQKTSVALGVDDHSGIVWDEIVGYLITMAFVPTNVITVILGFLLFRLFDIVKPWPIRNLDRKLHGGVGIMLDDVLAGLYAAIVLQGLLYFTL